MTAPMMIIIIMINADQKELRCHFICAPRLSCSLGMSVSFGAELCCEKFAGRIESVLLPLSLRWRMAATGLLSALWLPLTTSLVSSSGHTLAWVSVRPPTCATRMSAVSRRAVAPPAQRYHRARRRRQAHASESFHWQRRPEVQQFARRTVCVEPNSVPN